MLMMNRAVPEPDPIDPEQLLTIRQVAQMLQYSEQTIRNRIASGTFLPPTHRDGRLVRWRRADILSFMERFKNRKLW